MILLTESEVINVAILFLKTYYELTKPDDSGILMSSLIRLKSYEPKILDDKNIWNDWNQTIQLYKKRKIINIFTEQEAFEIFEHFLELYFKRTASNDIRSFLSDILHNEYGETADPAAWYDWKKCLNEVKTTKH
jgi:hypothetical protein